MKTYKIYLAIFIGLLALYIYIEVSKPKPVNWEISLKQNDKNPYGAYILYHSLSDYFSGAHVEVSRLPVYSLLSRRDSLPHSRSAYFLLAPSLKFSKEDVAKLLQYVQKGNYAFVSSNAFSSYLHDTLHFATDRTIELLDSTYINFTNQKLKTSKGYTFRKLTINNAFKETERKDSLYMLGYTMQNKKPNFLQFDIGKGKLFLHASPLCFSNLFYLTGNNADYADKALSYIPANITNIYWDEYYKQGRYGSATPLRVLLANFWTKWAVFFGMVLLLIYLFFVTKRKQRVIPVIKPLQNKSLTFAQTIASLYYNKRENTLIANKRLQYFTDFVRRRYGITQHITDEHFTETLLRKSGTDEEIIKKIVARAKALDYHITDNELEIFNKNLETFYQSAKV